MLKITKLSITVLALLFFASPLFGETAGGRITITVDLSAHEQNKKVQLWLPYPVTNHYQSITDIKVEGNYSSSAVYTDSIYQNPILYASWHEKTANRNLTFIFNVEREEVEKRSFPIKETAWDPADYSLYLTPTKFGPVNGEVKKLADKITTGKTGVLEKAKAIYDWTCENTWRNPETRGCGIGDMSRLLKNPCGKCADISSVFVALTRAAGVPSREILGIRQGKKPVQDITKWQHCWAEFFLPGYGWVPVDPADVRKMMLTEKLKRSDAKTINYRNYFWGGIDPYRIKLGEGRDLKLNPPQHGEPVNYLMYPFAQVGEDTLDWLDPETFKYTIIYTETPK